MVGIKETILSEQYLKKTGTKVVKSIRNGKVAKEVFPGPATDTFQRGIESIKVQKTQKENIFYVKNKTGIITAIFGKNNAKDFIKGILKK